MYRRLIANGIGCLGIACSLAFWVWIAILPHLSFHQRSVWIRLDPGVSDVWPALWLAGFLIPLVSAVIGSRRWIFAMVVPVVSCAAAVVYLTKIHP